MKILKDLIIDLKMQNEQYRVELKEQNELCHRYLAQIEKLEEVNVTLGKQHKGDQEKFQDLDKEFRNKIKNINLRNYRQLNEVVQMREKEKVVFEKEQDVYQLQIKKY